MPFARELYIERDDFMEDPPKKFFRLAPGREVRLRNAYLITCQRRHQGRRRRRSSSCTAPTTRPPAAATRPTDARSRPRCTGSSAAHAVDAEVRLYDRLFTAEDPESAAEKAGQQFLDLLNPNSLEAVMGCKLEPMLGQAPAGARFQFERLGYFAADPDGRPGAPVFNRTVSLKEAWTKARDL